MGRQEASQPEFGCDLLELVPCALHFVLKALALGKKLGGRPARQGGGANPAAHSPRHVPEFRESYRSHPRDFQPMGIRYPYDLQYGGMVPAELAQDRFSDLKRKTLYRKWIVQLHRWPYPLLET